MADPIVKLEKKHKQMQGKAKRFTVKNGEKLKKMVIDAVEATWDCEDDFIEALEAAKNRGMTGSKPGDYSKDKDCATTFAKFKKAAAKHAKDAKSLEQFCDGARTYVKDFVKLGLEVDKEQKPLKDKKSPTFKKLEKMRADIKNDEAEVTKVSEIPGTMTMPQLLYGKNFDKVVLRVMKQAKGGAVELDKILEKDEVTKNLRLAKKWSTAADKLCDAAQAKAAEPKSAKAMMTKAAKVLKKLENMQKDYAAAVKKHAKKLKEDKEAAKVLKPIDEIKKLALAGLKKRDETVKLLTAK